MKRKSFYIVIAAAVIALTVLIICGANILHSARYGEAVLKLVEQKFDTTPSLGKLVNLELACAIPWGQDVNGVDFLPGEGVLLQENIKLSTSSPTLKHRSIHITLPVKSYRSGKLAPGKVEVKIDRPLHKSSVKKQTLSCDLPAMEFAPLKVKNPDQLPLAGEAQANSKKSAMSVVWVIAAALLLFAAILYAVIKYRKNRQTQQEVLPPWEVARRNLAELRKTADAGKQPLEWCVVKLTDVVREYLSIRFNWRARQQTTEEFFASLKRRNSPLSTTQTFYLEEFMKQSDLIKFANIKPDKESFARAVDRAEDLVNETGIAAENTNHAPETR